MAYNHNHIIVTWCVEVRLCLCSSYMDIMYSTVKTASVVLCRFERSHDTDVQYALQHYKQSLFHVAPNSVALH